MIRIVTDSTCDIPRKQWDPMGLTVVSLPIYFGERCFKDGREMTHLDFYKALEKSTKLPTTSQVNPSEFEEVFQPFIDQGDEIVGIFLSSDLSGTMQSALIAANAVDPENIYIVDSRSGSLGTAFLIREAVKMRDSGEYTASEIAKTLQRLAMRIKIVAVVETLKYLKMGGRISATSAMMGGLLGIKPVLEVFDGKVSAIDKTRGDQNGMKVLLKLTQKFEPDPAYGIAFGHSNAEERMERYIEHFMPSLPEEIAGIHRSWMGSVIGAHVGPGVVAVAFIMKEQAQ